MHYYEAVVYIYIVQKTTNAQDYIIHKIYKLLLYGDMKMSAFIHIYIF